ncbi:MAG: hypothetical protein KUG70_01885 [Rhodobacteraceae bacterium]|nr:hypothetical protein [Paracoccaceae bacterium]
MSDISLSDIKRLADKLSISRADNMAEVSSSHRVSNVAQLLRPRLNPVLVGFTQIQMTRRVA